MLGTGRLAAAGSRAGARQRSVSKIPFFAASINSFHDEDRKKSTTLSGELRTATVSSSYETWTQPPFSQNVLVRHLIGSGPAVVNAPSRGDRQL